MIRRFCYLSLLAAIAALTYVEVARADCRYDSLPKDQCTRVTALSSRWKGDALSKINVVMASERVQRDDEVGACRYDEARDVIEMSAKAFAYSDAALVQCLATAFAQARYASIEGQWLDHLGEHEAWIVRGGKATKVASSGRKIEAAVARSLWASLASRELVALAASGDDASRSIASDAPVAASDPVIAQLLGAQ